MFAFLGNEPLRNHESSDLGNEVRPESRCACLRMQIRKQRLLISGAHGQQKDPPARTGGPSILWHIDHASLAILTALRTICRAPSGGSMFIKQRGYFVLLCHAKE